MKPPFSFLIGVLALLLAGLIGAYYVAAVPGASAREGIVQTLLYLLSPWMLVTEALTFGFVAYGYVFLHSSPWTARDVTTVDGLLRRQRFRLLLVLSLFSLGLAAIGSLFALTLEQGADQQSLAQTQTVARLKAQQVDKWLYERSIDAELAATALQSLPLDQWTNNGEVRQFTAVLLSEILAGHPERVAVALFAPDGQPLARLGQEMQSDGTGPSTDADSRKTGLKIIYSGLRDGAASKLGLSFVLPIRKRDSDEAMGILGITVDPALGLLKEVVAWPGSSASGEILLARRDGDGIVYLTPPRSPSALKDLLPAQAFGGVAYAGEGTDSGGARVAVATAPIRGAEWYVVVKIDRDEMWVPARRKIVTLAVVIVGTILFAGLVVGILWHGQRAGLLAYRTRQLEERAALTHHYQHMVESVRDAVFLTDANSDIVEANDAATRIYGYSLAEFRTMNGKDLRAPEEQATFEQQWRPAVGQLGHRYETVHRRKDGTTFPVEVANNAFDIGGTTYYQGFVRDISERKSLELRLARLGRIQKALFNAGSVLLRARTEDELLQGMCRILVEDGGYRLVDVAAPNHDEAKSVRFLAIVGKDDGYLTGANISWGSGSRSIGPTGTAIRDGVIQVNQDFKSNPRMAPWRDAALQRGLQSSTGLPLRVSGEIFGALTLYAGQPDAFDEEEVAMLKRFAEDIEYGLARLRDDLAA